MTDHLPWSGFKECATFDHGSSDLLDYRSASSHLPVVGLFAFPVQHFPISSSQFIEEFRVSGEGADGMHPKILGCLHADMRKAPRNALQLNIPFGSRYRRRSFSIHLENRFIRITDEWKPLIAVRKYNCLTRHAKFIIKAGQNFTWRDIFISFMRSWMNWTPKTYQILSAWIEMWCWFEMTA